MDRPEYQVLKSKLGLRSGGVLVVKELVVGIVIVIKSHVCVSNDIDVLFLFYLKLGG